MLDPDSTRRRTGADEIEQQRRRGDADVAGPLLDRRQRRCDETPDPDAVEARHRDILRHAKAEPAQGRDDRERKQVVGRDDGRRPQAIHGGCQVDIFRPLQEIDLEWRRCPDSGIRQCSREPRVAQSRPVRGTEAAGHEDETPVAQPQ